MSKETYLGDGVYARLDEANQIVVLHVDRSSDPRGNYMGQARHWIALEPEVLANLLDFACAVGLGKIVVEAAAKHALTTDDDYARAEEDAERKRDAAEDFEDL